MHLLVLGAFWLRRWAGPARAARLNAPSGAGCFLTSLVWDGEDIAAMS